MSNKGVLQQNSSISQINPNAIYLSESDVVKLRYNKIQKWQNTSELLVAKNLPI